MAERLANLGLCGRVWRSEMELELKEKNVPFESNLQRKQRQLKKQAKMKDQIDHTQAHIQADMEMMNALRAQFLSFLRRNPSRGPLNENDPTPASFQNDAELETNDSSILVEDESDESDTELEDAFAEMNDLNQEDVEAESTVASCSSTVPPQKRLRGDDGMFTFNKNS